MPDYVAMALPPEEASERKPPITWVTQQAIKIFEDRDLFEEDRYFLFNQLQERYAMVKELRRLNPGRGHQLREESTTVTRVARVNPGTK